jgi:hypothetical protein
MSRIASRKPLERHHVGASAERAERQSAAVIFAERGEVTAASNWAWLSAQRVA